MVRVPSEYNVYQGSQYSVSEGSFHTHSVQSSSHRQAHKLERSVLHSLIQKTTTFVSNSALLRTSNSTPLV